MERSEVSFELSGPGQDPNNRSQIPYPQDQHETDQIFDNRNYGYDVSSTVRNPVTTQYQNQGQGQSQQQPHQQPPAKHTPYLRQFHSLPPNIRNPNEPLPIATHLDQLEHISQLHLHQGSVCQFPQKVRNTGEKLPDHLHIGEAEAEKLALHQGSVVQFPTKIRDPEEKYPDSSHLHEFEHLKDLHLHQGSVCQFPQKVSKTGDKFPEGPHLQEVEDLKNLHLKQGSVVQFPANVNLNKDDYFRPPEDPLKESLPLAHVPHPDHCLPSAARQQQTYITHPPHGLSKLVVRGVSQSPSGSPRRGRSQSPGQWPPNEHEMPRKQYHAEGGPKTFMWPPQKPEFHRSFQELPPPGPTANNVWNPSGNNSINRAFAGFAPQRRQYNWPPNNMQRSSRLGSQQTSEKSRSMLELDEVCVIQSTGSVAPYRPPPWSQFYKPAYYTEA